MRQNCTVMEKLGLAVALVIFPIIAIEAQLPNGLCVLEDAACEFEETNLVGIVDGITSPEECAETCKNSSPGCEIYTHFGPNSFPFVNTCLLFNGCEKLNECDGCFTEDIECTPIFCDGPVEGTLGDNLIQVLPETEDEPLCKDACDSEEECKFYTHHSNNSTLFPSTCFLLKAIQEPIVQCTNGTCTTGSSNCQSSLCGLLDGDGYLYTNDLIEDDKNIAMVRIGPCQDVVIVAIGGGGRSGDNPPGAGSGYVEYTQLSVNRSYAEYSAHVGSSEEASELTDLLLGSILRAEPGQDSGARCSYCAGDGYSGGGGCGDFETSGEACNETRIKSPVNYHGILQECPEAKTVETGEMELGDFHLREEEAVAWP